MTLLKARLLIIIPALFFLGACTDDENNKEELTGNHVWKQQTDTLQTSKDVAKQLQQSLDKQQEQLNTND